uniref:Uncharacterized protein n=1 Tax=Oryza punctata TaxID=4537 RepID=A0A0E0LKB0_ORYPU
MATESVEDERDSGRERRGRWRENSERGVKIRCRVGGWMDKDGRERAAKTTRPRLPRRHPFCTEPLSYGSRSPWRGTGPLEAIREQQAKLGSVFTASALFGLFKVTFLIGLEVSSHFYVAPDSEISMGRLYEFTCPSLGLGRGAAADCRRRSSLSGPKNSKTKASGDDFEGSASDRGLSSVAGDE